MSESSDHSYVVELLRVESDAIAGAAARLQGSQLDHVLAILKACKGKVVVLGVGKSGIIAQKIAATMTSSGTAAIHLHPSDALHGGLGIVTSDDVVLMLSNSGETGERKGDAIGAWAQLGNRVAAAAVSDDGTRNDATNNKTAGGQAGSEKAPEDAATENRPERQ